MHSRIVSPMGVRFFGGNREGRKASAYSIFLALTDFVAPATELV